MSITDSSISSRKSLRAGSGKTVLARELVRAVAPGPALKRELSSNGARMLFGAS